MNDAGLLSSSAMSSERDLAADLAEEIRAAVAQAAPTSGGSSAPPDVAAGQVHGTLGRARAYLTPAVPEGARLSRVKRLLLRVFRFLWRDQAAFNALVLEAAAGLAEELADARLRLDGARRELQSAREELDSRDRDLHGALEKRIGQWSAAWEQRSAIQDGRMALL